jgi:hypothetical protein
VEWSFEYFTGVQGVPCSNHSLGAVTKVAEGKMKPVDKPCDEVPWSRSRAGFDENAGGARGHDDRAGLGTEAGEANQPVVRRLLHRMQA